MGKIQIGEMDTRDYIELQKKYSGEFVAFYKELVIAHAKTFDVLCKSVDDKIGDDNLLIEYIDPYDAVCIYRVSAS